MNCDKLFSRAFSFICLLGFLVQVQQVSQLYFRFQTTSRTSFQVREINNYQSIMYCPRFFEIVDRNKEKGFGMPAQLSKTFNQYLRYLSNLSVKDVLELTPPESEAIHGCTVRLGKTSTPTVFDNSKCKLYFNVTKSVFAEKICYTFIPTFDGNGFSAGDIASSFTYTGTVYNIIPAASISSSFYASFISVDNGNVEDFLHSRLFQVNTANQRTFNQSRILVFGDSIEIMRLPPPFDTACTAGHDQEICYEGCLIDKFKVINRLPWSGFHSQKLDMKILNPIEFSNETILDYAGQSLEECHSLCKQKTECFTQFSKTTILESQATSFYLTSALPSQPHMSVFAIPSLTLVEYIVQMGSCFGMWFGMSIISINPIKWKVIPRRDFITGLISKRRKRFNSRRSIDTVGKKIRFRKLFRKKTPPQNLSRTTINVRT